ncbi:WD40 repeat-like protein [Schizophyllum commune H4-8]|nr:WD40 repeat-like protein [Schizophyllum commune H4-8]KAI5895816.1 WD40 repeat-like protein [Schizophyllum commune H4-8]
MDSDSEYTEVASFPGHQDAVLSLSFSASGRFLAATGYSGVCVWDVIRKQRVAIPAPPSTPTTRHIYTRSAWLYFESTGLDVLVLGSQRGDVVLWQWDADDGVFNTGASGRHSAEDTQILSIDTHKVTVAYEERGRIAVGTDDGRLNIWSIPPLADKLRLKYSIKLEPAVRPKTVKFDKSSQDVIVFSLTGGIITVIDFQTGTTVGSTDDGPRIMASVAIDYVNSMMAAYTGSAFELLSLRTRKRIKSIASEAPNVYYPISVVFGEGGEVLLAGTDQGHALLYDIAEGRIRQILDYPKGGLVQQVAASTMDDGYYFALAGSTICRPADVILYLTIRTAARVGSAVYLSLLLLLLHLLLFLCYYDSLYAVYRHWSMAWA